MKRCCPNLDCKNHRDHPQYGLLSNQIVRKGTFYRLCDRRFITRYKCNVCLRQFSSSTFHEDYRQKRRDINKPIFELLCSGVSQRRLARILKVDRKTIVRKFRMLGHRSRLSHQAWLEKFKHQKVDQIQFDDLETSEHTKCKPLSVTLAVAKDSREILGFEVSQMPAKGLLAKISIQKYGYRADERPRGLDSLFQSLKTTVYGRAIFESDENPHYPKYLKRHFKKSTHIRYPGARGAVTGQGELKKLKFDPLFSLNHTCAMLRANLNRLFRRTWCITKNKQGLIDHLSLYLVYHNQVLLHSCPIKGGS